MMRVLRRVALVVASLLVIPAGALFILASLCYEWGTE